MRKKEESVSANIDLYIAAAKELVSRSGYNAAPDALMQFERGIREAFAQVLHGITVVENSPATTSVVKHSQLPSKLTPEEVASLWGRTKWKERGSENYHEKPPDFIRRIYGDLIGKGLKRADFRRKHPETGERVDWGFYHVLQQWLRNNKIPDDLELYSTSEITDKMVEAVCRGTPLEPQKMAQLEATLASRRARRLEKS